MSYLDDYSKTRTLFDRIGDGFSSLVSVFNAGWSIKNDYARKTRRLLITRGYDAAKKNRFTKNKVTTDGSANAELFSNNAIGAIRRETREQTRNNPVARGIKKALKAHIIGTGYTLQAAAVDNNGKLLDDFNDKIQILWRRWSNNPKLCDVRGKKTVNQFLSQAIGQYSDTGEYIINKTTGKSSFIPYKLQALESDLLDDQLIDESKNILGGVQIDTVGTPKAYYFLKENAINGINLSTIRNEHTRISAENIIHSYIEERPGQVRGEPWFAPVLNFLRSIHRSTEAELYTLEIQACLSVIYNSKTGGSNTLLGSQDENINSDGDRVGKLAPGMIMKTQGADSITVVDPKRPGNMFVPFVDKLVQYISAALDISYSKVTKDYSQGSFSSLRMNDQDDRRHLRPIQELIVSDILKPVYDEFVKWVVLEGHIKAPNFKTNSDLYTRAFFVPQPYEYIDPLKDVAADAKAISAGMKTLKSYYESRGIDFEQALSQIKLEQDFLKENDIQLSSFDPTKTQVQTASDMRS